MTNNMSVETKTILIVLLVEDSAVDVELIRTDLSAALPDVHVETADTFAKAREYLMNNKPDLVLLDLNLCGHQPSGCELVSQIRSMTEVPIVVITGDASLETAEAAVGAGADSCLVKGTRNADDLKRIIALALKRRETFIMQPKVHLSEKLARDAANMQELKRQTDANVAAMRENIERIRRVIHATAYGQGA